MFSLCFVLGFFCHLGDQSFERPVFCNKRFTSCYDGYAVVGIMIQLCHTITYNIFNQNVFICDIVARQRSTVQAAHPQISNCPTGLKTKTHHYLMVDFFNESMQWQTVTTRISPSVPLFLCPLFFFFSFFTIWERRQAIWCLNHRDLMSCFGGAIMFHLWTNPNTKIIRSLYFMINGFNHVIKYKMRSQLMLKVFKKLQDDMHIIRVR